MLRSLSASRFFRVIVRRQNSTSGSRSTAIDRGMKRLLEAYSSKGGRHVTAPDVHFYEVCLAAGWVCDELASKDSAMIEHATQPLRSLLRRFGAMRPSV